MPWHNGWEILPPPAVITSIELLSLQWRHNGHDGVSNHQPYDCLLNRSFSRKSKKTSKLRVTGLCTGNSPMTGEFPAQMASYAEIDDVIMWMRLWMTYRLEGTGVLQQPKYIIPWHNGWDILPHPAVITSIEPLCFPIRSTCLLGQHIITGAPLWLV